MNGLFLLRRYFVTSMRAQLQYPASSLMLAFSALLTNANELAGIWALFNRFGEVQGWRFGGSPVTAARDLACPTELGCVS